MIGERIPKNPIFLRIGETIKCIKQSPKVFYWLATEVTCLSVFTATSEKHAIKIKEQNSTLLDCKVTE